MPHVELLNAVTIIIHIADVFKSLFQANPDILIIMNEYLQFIGLILVDKPSIFD